MEGWQPDNPVALPNGVLVCEEHGWNICGYCCVDYSFTLPENRSDYDSFSEEDEDAPSDSHDDSDGEKDGLEDGGVVSWPDGMPKLRTMSFSKQPIPPDSQRLININRFKPPKTNDIPQLLYNHAPHLRRFIRHSNPLEMLIYTDGACINNGAPNPKAGWSFIFRSATESAGSGSVSGRLENKGPTGIPITQTSNRAELRAVIAALEFRYWPGEGWQRLVIATDSDYVVAGITRHIRKWAKNGWKNRERRTIANKDLWKYLLASIRELHEEGASLKLDGLSRGFEVLFWQIPRALNAQADTLAKAAAREDDVQEYGKVIGAMI